MISLLLLIQTKPSEILSQIVATIWRLVFSVKWNLWNQDIEMPSLFCYWMDFCSSQFIHPSRDCKKSKSRIWITCTNELSNLKGNGQYLKENYTLASFTQDKLKKNWINNKRNSLKHPFLCIPSFHNTMSYFSFTFPSSAGCTYLHIRISLSSLSVILWVEQCLYTILFGIYLSLEQEM